MAPIHFTPEMLTKPTPKGMDVETTLAHFAIVTYQVDPADLRPHVHERFALDCIPGADGKPRALISVVPFLDRDFRFLRFPWLKWKFGQTNYRAYVTDTVTGEHVAWFFGTSLASWTVNIPRFAWQLPWHHAQIQFITEYDSTARRYTKYQMTATSKWAAAQLELADSGQPPTALPGFDDLESGLALLTHPLKGYFYRRDGKLGGYSIWHDKLKLTLGHVVHANFPLLDQLGLVEAGDVAKVHSVLLQPATEFTIYLPPKLIEKP